MSQSKVTYIFLIHGWGGSANSLFAMREQLQKKMDNGQVNSLQTQIIELPGFGQTYLDKVYTFQDYVDFVEQKINERMQLADPESSELVMIGHSFGGKIILQLAAENSFPQAKLVLINASGIFPNNSTKKRVFKLITSLIRPFKWLLTRLQLQGFLALLTKVFYKYIVGTRDYQKIENPQLKETFTNVISVHIAETDLTKINNHTLLLWGERDKDTPLWMAEKMAHAIPGSILEVVPEAGHGLPLKQPELCAEKISTWLGARSNHTQKV